MAAPIPNNLLAAVHRTAAALSEPGMASLLRALTATAGTEERFLLSVALPAERAAVADLLSQWRLCKNVSFPVLAAALQGAAFSLTANRSQTNTELIWTGPSPEGASMLLRRTDQALLEVIRSARTELLLVTFAAYKVDYVVEELVRAAQRGVRTCFVSESPEESEGRLLFSASRALDAVRSQVTVYIWPRERRTRDSRNRVGSLHAKCAIADSDLLLISSANLTESALSLNMELGVLIRGGTLPGRVRSLWDRIIQSGELIPSPPEPTTV